MTGTTTDEGLRRELQSLAAQRRHAETARSEAMTRTRDLLRVGRAAGVPIAHLARWADITRQTVYDLTGPDT